MHNNEIIWAQKYRPKTIQETILPVDLKRDFQAFIDSKELPNLILVGKSGVGKTTAAIALCTELGADYIVINGSLSGNIDTLRNDIKEFASSVSFAGGRKYVILDEADYLNINSTQPALRNFMEEYSKGCGFILTCNYLARIIEPLQSRCSVIHFDLPKEEVPTLASEFHKRLCNILTTEGIEFDKRAVAEFIQKHFPNWRRVINELQRYSKRGRIDVGILANITEDSINELYKLIKARNWKEMRKWVALNADQDANTILRALFDTMQDRLKPNCIPELIVLIGKYQYQAALVTDQEINTSACLVEFMATAEFN